MDRPSFPVKVAEQFQSGHSCSLVALRNCHILTGRSCCLLKAYEHMCLTIPRRNPSFRLSQKNKNQQYQYWNEERVTFKKFQAHYEKENNGDHEEHTSEEFILMWLLLGSLLLLFPLRDTGLIERLEIINSLLGSLLLLFFLLRVLGIITSTSN